jgi:tripartite ATP-independent transporter DctM subunit
MLTLFVIMLILFVMGTPIAWSIAVAATLYMAFATDIPLQAMVQRMVGGIDTFPLLAIPFFILAGNLMNTGGITHRLIAFAKVMVGHITGGLAHVNIVTSMIMAGMSGSGVADAAGTSSVLVPAMKKAGFPGPFSSAVTAASATIGPIVPPSIPFVIYGSLANVSVGRLLLAGAVPGILMGICLLIFAYVISKRRHYPAEARASCGQIVQATASALPPMGMPVIILGGIIGGVMTPTEAAAAGAAYALVLGLFVYKEIKPMMLPTIIVESMVATASVLIIMSAAQPFGWILTFEQAPVKVLAFFSQVQLDSWQLLLILNVAILLLGMFMEGMAIMIMSMPVLLPLLAASGIDPLHFGVVFVINIMIGAITPPVGVIMYVVCAMGKVTVAQFSREIWPFLIALIMALMLVTYVPEISTWLPNLLMPTR